MEPTNRELKIVLDSLKDHINEKIGDVQGDLSEINDRVKTTNGRVKTLELWKSFLLGAWAVTTAFVIPLIIYVWIQNVSVKDAVAASVQDALAQYEIKVEP